MTTAFTSFTFSDVKRFLEDRISWRKVKGTDGIESAANNPLTTGMTAFTYFDAKHFLEDRTSCTIPDTFTSIADEAFFIVNNTFNLLHTVVIPNTITSMGGYAFLSCRSLKYIAVPDAALNNNNYGMHNGIYRDPFYRCTELIASAQLFNMSVKEYLIHQNRISRRVAVLYSLKTINNARILAKSEGREFVWGNPIGPENRRRLNGVLAESRIPPFEMWREVVMFL